MPSLITAMAVGLHQETPSHSHESSTLTKHISIEHKISSTDVVKLAAESNIIIPLEHEAEWAEVLSGLDDSARQVLELEDYIPIVDLKKYPRGDVHVPTDTVRGGWVLKVFILDEIIKILTLYITDENKR